MTETIGEMIIPGTYIEVRAEGLIGVGGISTGTIGVVGTANRGPVDEPVILGSYADALSVFGTYDPFPDDPATPHLTLVRALEQIFRGGGSTVHAVRIAALPAGLAAMRAMGWRVRAGNNAEILALTATSPGTWANAITVALAAPEAPSTDVTLTVTFGAIRETFRGANAGVLAREINDASSLIRAGTPSNAASVPASVVPVAATEAGGPDGAAVTATHVGAGLALLASRPINIVNVAGLGADTIGATVLAHVNATETDGMERIAVVGTRDDTLAGIASDANGVSSGRVILVAPGILATDAAAAGASVELPPAYAASMVAGKLGSLAVQVSLTNKDVPADGLSREFNRAEQKQLLQNRIMALHRNLGIRALRGITTDTGAFTQISVRRIVDYAKAGVRMGANPYIGRLNNARVRAAMKATLDGFLSQMVLDERLTAYELEVAATRAQEINGIAEVTMTLQPTFSIDFIRVTMILQ